MDTLKVVASTIIGYSMIIGTTIFVIKNTKPTRGIGINILLLLLGVTLLPASAVITYLTILEMAYFPDYPNLIPKDIFIASLGISFILAGVSMLFVSILGFIKTFHSDW